MDEVWQRHQEMERLKAACPRLFNEMAAILFRHDPIGINFEQNTDEYEPEVGTLLPRLSQALSPEDVQTLLHEEFVRWFDADIAGPKAKYAPIADEIWNLWQRHVEQRRVK